MIQKISILITFSLLSFFSIQAQNGNITGKIVSSTNEVIYNANVSLKNTSKGTTTDENGSYQIFNITPGSYILHVSFVGYQTKEINIEVTPGTNSIPTITIQEGQEQLGEVVINGHKANKFAKETSVFVSKMPLKDIENPQVYNTISHTVLEDQIITNFDDALKNAPGIDKLWESTGRGSDGAGYFSLRGFAVQPTMVNGLPALTNGSPDPANIESIEVIKGPSGTLYGSSLISYGGLINITTKRPYYGFGGNVSYTAGSYGLNRVTADVNTTLGAKENVAVRINTAYHTQNSFQDAGFRKSFYFAPSLAYQVNDKLSFNFNTEFYNGKSTNQTMLFLDRGAELRVHNIDELNYNHKRSYTGNDLYIETPTYSLQGLMNYKINDQWTSQTAISRSSSKSEGYYSYMYEITRFTPITDGIVFNRYTSKQNTETIATDIQQNFIGDFKIGGLRNRLVAGLDYYSSRVINNSGGYGSHGAIYLGNNTDQYNMFNELVLGNTSGDPTTYTDDSGILTQSGADQAILSATNPGASGFGDVKQNVFSVYASDVINILPSLSAMVSIRFDRFMNEGDVTTEDDDYNQSAFSPKFGLVFQPIMDKVAVFANYMDGFSNVDPTTTPSGNTLTFDPEHAKQFEFGTKLNLLDNRLAATLSYYDIRVTDRVLSIDPETYVQDGEQRSKGFEASFTASPIAGLNIIAGYSYNDSELVEGAEDFKGLRPESAGPQNLANLWASYRFMDGTLKNFGLGFGGNYASENKIFNRNLGGTFTLDEYVILNASTFYDSDNYRITLKLDNIGNVEYYKGWSTISPQNLRSVSANFTYKF